MATTSSEFEKATDYRFKEDDIARAKALNAAAILAWGDGDTAAARNLAAQAVAPSYMEAFATSMPVMSATWVWNSKRYWSVPWETSG